MKKIIPFNQWYYKEEFRESDAEMCIRDRPLHGLFHEAPPGQNH